MADNSGGRGSYPKIAASTWWELRRRAQQSPPKEVNSSYLQTVLNIGEGTAKNILPNLRAVGLVDENYKPTDLMNDWRDDDLYLEVCRKMREALYPDGLLDALPAPNPDRTQVIKWFMRTLNIGEPAARQVGTFYILLCEADPGSATSTTTPKKEKTSSKERSGIPKPVRTISTNPRQIDVPQAAESKTETDVHKTSRQKPDPSLHIDIQIHISPDTSAKQIDQIFQAMAKYLYRS